MSAPRPEDASGQLDNLRTMFRDSIHEHGVTSAGVGWPDPATHKLRFDKLATVFEGNSGGFSVNDLGAGWGALFPYLVEERGFDVERYVGYEVSPEMLAAARATVTDSRATFVEASSATQDADYSIACGTFNVKCDANDDDWLEYVLRSLRALAERSARGLAFNMMSTYVDWRNEILYYGDPGFFFDFCKRELSRSVALLHDYPLWEWTIVVRL
ncbi:MAG TPA: class I SAM-dependent methyltransferase [Gaiellaceae bacterium]|jgi:hypothetical protein|nr:class I SAM-dependent methyltransferase [Gaiellaceae bacterium]